MNLLAYDITEASVTFIADDGVPRSAHQSHPNYPKIRQDLLSGTADAEQLILLVDTKVAIEGKCFGLVTVGADAVWYKAQQIQGYLVEKLLAMLGDGVDIEPWARLLDNLMHNPELSARDRLPLFLTNNNLPLTRDGYFLGWRLVKDDYWDIHTGNTFHNMPGAILEQDRNTCDSNPDQTCSSGIHVAAFEYLGSYGFNSSGNRCMLVKVNPADVVAVPTDYNNAKLRACKIEVLREVAKELVPALFNRSVHVTSEHGYVEDGDDFDNFDDEDDVFVAETEAEFAAEAGDLTETEVEVASPPLADNSPGLVDEGIVFPPSLTIKREDKKKLTNGRKYYLAGEAGEWIVVRRSTGKVKKTFESRDKARAHVRKLNG